MSASEQCYAEAVGMHEHCRGDACTSEMCGPRDADGRFAEEPTECAGCESPLCPTHGSLR